MYILQHNSREMLQEEDQRLSHWAESREEHSLPGPGLHPVHWWEDKGAGLVPSCQPTPHQQRPAGVHSQILTHLTKTDIRFDFISCMFFQENTIFPWTKREKKTNRKFDLKKKQTLMNKTIGQFVGVCFWILPQEWKFALD